MARNPPPPRKDDCVDAIRKHLAAGGTTLTQIYEAFPEIPRPTIYRWYQAEREGKPTALEMSRAARAIQERAEAGITDHLPAVPSPAAVARDGGAAIRKLDFAVEIPKLYADAEMLRAFSVKEMEGEDGEKVEKIRNPVAFEKSIKARASLIETSLKVLQEVWDMRMMQQFNELIIDEIGRESPECQRRILQRLAILNQRNGINFHGMRI